MQDYTAKLREAIAQEYLGDLDIDQLPETLQKYYEEYAPPCTEELPDLCWCFERSSGEPSKAHPLKVVGAFEAYSYGFLLLKVSKEIPTFYTVRNEISKTWVERMKKAGGIKSKIFDVVEMLDEKAAKNFLKTPFGWNLLDPKKKDVKRVRIPLHIHVFFEMNIEVSLYYNPMVPDFNTIRIFT